KRVKVTPVPEPDGNGGFLDKARGGICKRSEFIASCREYSQKEVSVKNMQPPPQVHWHSENQSGTDVALGLAASASEMVHASDFVEEEEYPSEAQPWLDWDF